MTERCYGQLYYVVTNFDICMIYGIKNMKLRHVDVTLQIYQSATKF